MKTLQPRHITALILLCAAPTSCQRTKPRRATPDAGAAVRARRDEHPVNVVGARAQVTITADGARVSGTFTEEGHGIAGVNVVVLDAPTPSTAVSAASGAWSVEVPLQRPTYLRVTKDSYRTIQTGVVVAQAGEKRVPLEMVSAALFARLFHDLSLTESPNAGAVAVRFDVPGRQSGTIPVGFGATLSTGGGTAVVIGSGGPRRGNVTVSGEAVVIMLNVAPGTTTVSVQAPQGYTCEPDDGSLTTVRVDPQVITFVGFRCH